MENLSLLEDYFKRYRKDLSKWIPDGIIVIDLKVLNDLQLLHADEPVDAASLTTYFHVVETSEKITLINDQYVIWIVPDIIENIPITFTFVAKTVKETPLLELAFSTTGVYNTSRMILKILEKFLKEIEENEALMDRLN